MNWGNVRQIADAVMYEGYMLYPYRPSSVKNRQRWTFGGLYPAAYGIQNDSPSSMQSQFLVEGDGEPELELTVRFLHLLQREDGLQEGEPREVGPGKFELEEGERRRRVEGEVDIKVRRIAPALHRVTLCVTNRTDSQDPLAVLASTHAIVRVSNGAFISSTDPPECFSAPVSECVNIGVWPVLAGENGSHDCIFVTPIILSDYPQVAPESAGDLFDGAEIDEILSLRILTLTDREKSEIRAADSLGRRILERTESLSPEQMMRLHGVLRHPPETTVRVRGVDLKRGDKVRLYPRKRSDIMDIALAGQVAEIEAIEQDFDECVHLAVVLDCDPGKDLGSLRQPGHRFFFAPDEVEPLAFDLETRAEGAQ